MEIANLHLLYIDPTDSKPCFANCNNKNGSLASLMFYIMNIFKNDFSTRSVLTVLLFPMINGSVIVSADRREIKTEMCPRDGQFERKL